MRGTGSERCPVDYVIRLPVWRKFRSLFSFRSAVPFTLALPHYCVDPLSHYQPEPNVEKEGTYSGADDYHGSVEHNEGRQPCY